MAQVEKVLVNGRSLEVGAGLEGRIAQEVERTGAGSCVVVQVRVEKKSYSFTFPNGCTGGGGGGGGGGSAPAEINRLNRIYQAALDRLARNGAAIRGVVIEFINSL